jgi:hypothetical protein
MVEPTAAEVAQAAFRFSMPRWMPRRKSCPIDRVHASMVLDDRR